MKYNNLSTTNTKVSQACLGTMSFGAHVDEAVSNDIMNRSLELGINFFDTAEMYSIPTREATCGHTEEIIGRWIKNNNTRKDIILATKVVGPDHDLPWIREGKSKLNETNIRTAIEGSLRRLQTDYIDLYQLHWSDRDVNNFGTRYFKQNLKDNPVAIEETLNVLQKLKQEGKVKHFGLSNETPWGTQEFLRLAKEKNLPRMVSVQNNYSLLTRTYDMGMSEVSLNEDIGLLAYSPLGFGVLGGRYLDGNKPKGGRFTQYPTFLARYQTPEVEAAIKRYKVLAEANDMTLPQLALAFVYQQPFLTSNIIGPSSVEQLDDCINAMNIKLSEEILAEINKIDDIYPNPCA